MKTTDGSTRKLLNLAGEQIYYTPIAIKDEKLTDATDTGEVLTKKQLQPSLYKYYTSDGKEYVGKVYKLQNGELVAKTTQTKSVTAEQIGTTELKLAYDLIYEKEYFCNVSPSFADKLRTCDKAFKFPFSAGSGYKPAIALLFYDNFTDCVLMRTGRTTRSKIIANITQTTATKESVKASLKALQGTDKVVATAKLEVDI